MYPHRRRRGRFSGVFLMALALGACDRRAQPAAGPATPPSAPSAAAAMEAPPEPVPAKEVPTRLSVALLEPASTTAAAGNNESFNERRSDVSAKARFEDAFA